MNIAPKFNLVKCTTLKSRIRYNSIRNRQVCPISRWTRTILTVHHQFDLLFINFFNTISNSLLKHCFKCKVTIWMIKHCIFDTQNYVTSFIFLFLYCRVIIFYRFIFPEVCNATCKLRKHYGKPKLLHKLETFNFNN